MTVIYKGEAYDGRTAQNDLGIRTYTRAFWLETTVVTEGAFAVGSNASLPIIGSVHPEDSTAWCRSLSVDNTNPWKVWRVTANYSSEFELNTNPTSDPAIINWDTEQFQKPAVFDYSGNAICNSAGDLFDPPVMVDDSRRTVTITKNLATVPSWILSYQDAVNSDAFSIDGFSIAVGKAKMQRVAVAAKERRNGTSFYPVTFTIHLQKSGWRIEPLDCGFRKKGTTTTQRENITNDDGTAPPAPVFLNGSGGILANPSLTNAVFLNFTYYETKVFSSLPLS